ncbi:uncharacterized protein CCR75_002950 [Bremia lactucae]|uniref:Phosphatidic acid phosphatase type 2/haloperoxidase domain-containing protein n=1 Tax=Bremia lactucae TaxID=4779 RepID=A0A976NZT2_BRELC|nr:hypothetical protein CCR75_002950 [Bremia lactucae]
MHRRNASTIAALLTLLICLTSVAAAENGSCSSHEGCCLLCGDELERCLRGPCSMHWITRSFFSISAPVIDVGFWDVAFSFYGTVPYLVPVAILLDFIFYCRSWTRLFAFLFIPIVALINSGILVTILGDCSDCPRPCGSCVSSNGMPSGHATNAIGLFMWILLESLLGVGYQWKMVKKVAVCVGITLLLIPVPYSRIYLGDHTRLQVVIGCINGVLFGLFYFFVLRYGIGRRLSVATKRINEGRFHFLHMVNDFYVDRRYLLNSQFNVEDQQSV